MTKLEGEPTGNPAQDLRDWTGLTNPELASMCGISNRRFKEWTRGAKMRPVNESRLLGLREIAQVLVTTLEVNGTRKWLTAMHPSLEGLSPLQVLIERHDRDVKLIVDIFLETAAT